MAELLDPTEVMFTAFEPKVANRFIMYVEGIPSYLIKAASRPSIDQGELILDHINVERKLKGKSRWQDVTVTLFYKKDIVFNTLGPVGDKVEEWTLKGAYISAATFGDMDWATEDPVNIELTLKYDYAILQF